MSILNPKSLNRIVSTLSLMAFASIVVSSLPAHADNAAPSSNGSTTTGYVLDPTIEFSKGALQTRPFELEASGGFISDSTGDQGATLRANARVPLHLWGSQSDEYIRGLLVEPGVEARVDVTGGEATRTSVEAKGAALFRLQGSNVSATPADIAARDNLLMELAAPLDEIAKKYATKLVNNQDSSATRIIVAEAEAEVSKLIESRPEILAMLERRYQLSADDSYYDIPSGSYSLVKVSERIVDNIQAHAGNKLIPSGHALIKEERDSFTPKRSEVNSTGEVIVGRASFVHHNDKNTKTRQTGARLAPLEVGGAWAFRVGSHVNIDQCLNGVPLAFLAGENENRAPLSSSVEACMGVTIGELPTVRNTTSLTGRYDTTHHDAGGERGYTVMSTTALEKKLGPVTPQLMHVYEREGNTNGPTVESHSAMVGISVTPN